MLTVILYTDLRNGHCIKRLILIRIVTPPISEAIIVTNEYLIMYTIKASAHMLALCSILSQEVQFSHQVLTPFQFSSDLAQLYIWLNLSNKLLKAKIALCSKLCKNCPLYDQPNPSVFGTQ